MRRNTVKPNLQVLLPLIKEKFRSNVVFTKEVRGKDKSGWISEWRRGKNFPSPEEAARMCILLEITPEEILLHEGETDEETAKCLEDIQRVKELVEELTAESEEKRSAKGEALSPVEQEIFDFISAASVEEIAEVLRFIGYLKSKREQAHGPSEI